MNQRTELMAAALRQQDFNAVLAQYEASLGEGFLDPATMNLAAVAYLQLNKYPQAIQTIEQAIRLAPSNVAVINNAGNIYWQTGHLQKAREYLGQALEMQPHNDNVIGNLSQVYAVSGDVDKGIAILLQSVSRDPENSIQLHRLANLYIKKGDREGARKALHALIQSDREKQPGAYYDWVRVNQSTDKDALLLGTLKSLAKEKWVDRTGLSFIYFALGEIYRNSGKHEQAFGFYKFANGAVAESQRFDLDGFQAQVEAELANNSAPAGLAATAARPQPVFIIGMPRSGTSLLEQALSSHSQIAGIGECKVIDEHIRRLKRKGLASVKDIPEQLLGELRQEYLQRLPGYAQDKTVVLDKAPLNFMYLRYIHRILPEAQFIWCSRHPLDTILSCYFQNFNRGMKFSFDLDDITQVQIAAVRLRAHWRELFSGRFIEIEYEQLASEPEPHLKQLVASLGLEWEAAVLRPEDNPSLVNTASQWQVRRAINTESIGRWNHYEPFLSKAKAALQQAGIDT